MLWLKPKLIVHFDTYRIYDSKFVHYLNTNDYFGSSKTFNMRILGLFPITLSFFSQFFNSQWHSGCCVLDFHSNVLSSIPAIIIFLKTLSACTVILNLGLFGLFPITLYIFSHLFNSQWRSVCELVFHYNVLSSIPSIIIFLALCQRAESFESTGLFFSFSGAPKTMFSQDIVA